MRVFISHSFDDSEKFSDLENVLSQHEIECFQPNNMMIGRGLSDQLRSELERCDALVFIATRNSIRSDWCNAELGAAWGLQKLVAIYLADSDLDVNELPGQFRGQLMQKSIFGLAKSLKEQLSEDIRTQSHTSGLTGSLIGTEFVEELRSILREEIERGRVQMWAHEVLFDLRNIIASQDWKKNVNRVDALLHRLLGQSYAHIPSPRTIGWPFQFRVKTTTGTWTGWALSMEEHAGGDLEIYRHCILMHLDEAGRINGLSAAHDVLEESVVGMLGLSPWTKNETYPPIVVGETSLGTAIVRRNQVS